MCPNDKKCRAKSKNEKGHLRYLYFYNNLCYNNYEDKLVTFSLRYCQRLTVFNRANHLQD